MASFFRQTRAFVMRNILQLAFTVLVIATVSFKSLRSIGIKYEDAYKRFGEFQELQVAPLEVREYGAEWDYYEKVLIEKAEKSYSMLVETWRLHCIELPIVVNEDGET